MKFGPYKLIFPILVLFILTGCLKKAKETGEAGSANANANDDTLATIPTDGVGKNSHGAGLDSEPICGPKDDSTALSGTFQCHPVNRVDGKSIRATEIETSVSDAGEELHAVINWQQPVEVRRDADGNEYVPSAQESNVESISCMPSDAGLVYTCTYRFKTEASTRVAIGMNVALRNAANQLIAQAPPKKAYFTPISVVSLGFVPAIARGFLAGSEGQIDDAEFAGYQTLVFNPRTVTMERGNPGCTDGQYYYAPYGGYVYRVQLSSGKAELYAGSSSSFDEMKVPGEEKNRTKAYLTPHLRAYCHPKNPGVVWIVSQSYHPISDSAYYTNEGEQDSEEVTQIYLAQGDKIKYVTRANPVSLGQELDSSQSVTALSLHAAKAFAAGKGGELYLSDRNGIHMIDKTASTVERIAGVGPCANWTSASTYSPSYTDDGSDPDQADFDAAQMQYYLCTQTGAGFYGDGGLAHQAMLNEPKSLTVSMDGKDLYFLDSGNGRVRRIDLQTKIINTFHNYSGTQNSLLSFNPVYIAFGSDGSMYYANLYRIDRRRPDGTIENITGTGNPPFMDYVFPEGQSAIGKQIYTPFVMTVVPTIVEGGSDSLYFVSLRGGGLAHEVRAVKDVDGARTLSTIFGLVPGEVDHTAEKLVAETQLPEASDLAFAPNGDIFFTDPKEHRVFRITKNDDGERIIALFAGSGKAGCDNNISTATTTDLKSPRSIAVSPDGEYVLVADTGNHRVLKILMDGTTSKLAGENCQGFPSVNDTIDPGSASAEYIEICEEAETETFTDTNTYDETHYGESGYESGSGYDPSTTTTYSPSPSCNWQLAPPPDPSSCSPVITYPVGVTIAPDHTVYVATSGSVMSYDNSGEVEIVTNSIVKIANGATSYFIGGHCYYSEDTPIRPSDVAADKFGNVYAADPIGQKVYIINPSGAYSVYAGTGHPGNTGDGGLATLAKLHNPFLLAVDGRGHLHIAMGSELKRLHSTYPQSEGGYLISEGVGVIVRTVLKNEQGQNIIAQTMGGKSEETCASGSVEKTSATADAATHEDLADSVANYCMARVRAIGAYPFCGFENSNKTAFGIGQTFASLIVDSEEFDYAYAGYEDYMEETEQFSEAEASNFVISRLLCASGL